MECPDASIVRRLEAEENLYICGGGESAQTEEPDEGFSILKIVELIHEEYPNVDISNEGEKDFIIEYIPNPEKPKWINALKTVALCVVIFSGRRSRLWRSTTMYPWEMSFQILSAGDGKGVKRRDRT